MERDALSDRVKCLSTISNFQYILEKTGLLSTNQRQEIISCVLLSLEEGVEFRNHGPIILDGLIVLKSCTAMK